MSHEVTFNEIYFCGHIYYIQVYLDMRKLATEIVFLKLKLQCTIVNRNKITRQQQK